eukprot:TRINITY_DN1503_c6_g1_i1.p1 TRINITY_DN1503_c6_g1~~TRINITY_DN1503_c6_g1_i1.p1  ORF type:complete len:613 (-),score=101.55 TRINITY_DN1503_c6_g1_i1:1747-3585(-)
MMETRKVVLGTIAFVVFWVMAVFPSVKVLPIGRTAGTLASAVLMVMFQVLSPAEAYAAIDLPILGLLFGTMLVSAYLERCDLFENLRLLLTWRTQGSADLLCRLCLLAGAMSAVLTNDTACVTLTAFVLDLCHRKNLPPQPFLLALASSANIGSAATPIGNPQNVIIAIEGGISFDRFLYGVLPAVVVGLILNMLFLLGLYWGPLIGKGGIGNQGGIVTRTSSEGEGAVIVKGGGLKGEGERKGSEGREGRWDIGTDDVERQLRVPLIDHSNETSATAIPSSVNDTPVHSTDRTSFHSAADGPVLLAVLIEDQQRREGALERPQLPALHADGALTVHDRMLTEHADRGLTMPTTTASQQQEQQQQPQEQQQQEQQQQQVSQRCPHCQGPREVDEPEGHLLLLAAADEWPRRRFKWGVYLATMAMLACFLAGLNLSWVAVSAAVILMCLEYADATPMLLQKVSYPLLVFFSGMFIAVEGFNRTGLPGMLWEALAPYAGLDTVGGTAIMATVVTILSNLISNVPTVLLIGPRLAASAFFTPGVSKEHASLLLAWVSTVAGNFSLLGSAANIIVCEQASRAGRHGYELSFWSHLRFGLPSTIIISAIGCFLVRTA